MTWLCAWQSDRRVVVTGMGIVSCLGNSQDEVADSLHAAKAGIKFSEKYKEIGMPAVLTGTGRAARAYACRPPASQRTRPRRRAAWPRAPARCTHAARAPASGEHGAAPASGDLCRGTQA